MPWINLNVEHATPELWAALAKAQGEIENASKNSTNPHFKSRYADLAEVLNTVRPVFSAAGLAVLQSPGYSDTEVHVQTVVAHASGGYVIGTLSCIPQKPDAQGVGAASTYLRRYSLAAMAGIAQEDDDGERATGHKPQPEAPQKNPRLSPAQVSTLNDLIKAIGNVDMPAFFAYLGVGALEDLPAAKFEAAMKALEKKRGPRRDA